MRRTAPVAVLVGTLLLAVSPTANAEVSNGSSRPTISGGSAPLLDGEVLKGSNATYTIDFGTGPVTVTSVWVRCDSDGASNCVETSDTDSTHTVGPGDIGFTFIYRNRASCPASPAECGVPPYSDQDDSDPTAPVEARPPVNTSPPSIRRSGNSFLSNRGGWTGTPPLTFSYRWQRCSSGTCTDVPGSAGGGPDYTLTSADIGKGLRVIVIADNSAPGTAFAASPISAPISVPVIAPVLLSPFPRVAIAGRATGTGARISKLAVRAPTDTKVIVRCNGSGCPYHRRGILGIGSNKSLRFRALHRRLGVGTLIRVWIIHPTNIGKYTRFRIRSNRGPTRRDRCLPPGSNKGMACPN